MWGFKVCCSGDCVPMTHTSTDKEEFNIRLVFAYLKYIVKLFEGYEKEY